MYILLLFELNDKSVLPRGVIEQTLKITFKKVFLHEVINVLLIYVSSK